MKINISANIRKLRRLNGLTQEKLAEYLGVTYQAISKWENGVSLPNIEMLPVIANVFGVSIEELYGFNKRENDAKIAEYEAEYSELCKNGDNIGRVRLMRRALAEYPNNFVFVNYLARSLYRCADINKNAKEIISLCERILEDCKVDSLRFSALQTMARIYNDTGEKETALKYANEIPSMLSSKEFVLTGILTGEERVRQLQENIFYFTYNAGKALTYLASNYYGIGESLSCEEKIRLLKAANTLYKTIIDDGNYLILNGKFYWHYCMIAKNYCLMGDTDMAMENLLAAEKAAIEADKFFYSGKEKQYTALCVNRLKSNPKQAVKHWEGSNCEKLCKLMRHTGFDAMRDTLEFKALEHRLTTYKKE